jgi:hypothetical protein
MTTTLQKLATVFGIIIILLAIVGSFATGAMYMQPTDPAMAPKALGIFPVNLLHNIVHLVFGIWGLAAARSWGASKSFFIWGGVIYAVLTVLAFVSPSGFGMVPLAGADIGLHCLLAIVMLGIGLTARPVAPSTSGV